VTLRATFGDLVVMFKQSPTENVAHEAGPAAATANATRRTGKRGEDRAGVAAANGDDDVAVAADPPAGEQSGTVLLYQGSPSWLLVSISAAPTDGQYEMRVRDRGGELRTIGVCQLKDRSGTTGHQLDISVARVAQTQLTHDSQVRLTATLPN
jgi:hypothetical protein